MRDDAGYLLDMLLAAPWSEVIGMRHRLVHGYFEVDLQKVWDTVHRDLPLLIAQIEPLVPPEESNVSHHH